MQANYTTRMANGKFAKERYDELPPEYWLERCRHTAHSIQQMVGKDTYLLLVEMFFEDNWTARQDALELERLLTFGRDALFGMTECTCPPEQPDGRGMACRVCKARSALREAGELPVVGSHTSNYAQKDNSVTDLAERI